MGHATQMFACAAVLSDQYSSRPTLGLLNGLATEAGAERVSDHNHFTFNIMAGSVKGYLVGEALA